MKFDKAVAETIWLGTGRIIVGGILCGAGLVLANKGAWYNGMAHSYFQVYSTSREAFDMFYDKASKNF